MLNRKMVLGIMSICGLIGYSALADAPKPPAAPTPAVAPKPTAAPAVVPTPSSTTVIDCSKDISSPTLCNRGLSDAKQILDCIQKGKTYGRASGVGSMDDQKMYIDYLILTAKCQTKYPNIGFLPLAQFVTPITGKLNPKLEFYYYYGIVFNKLDDMAVAKAVALLSAYSGGEIKQQEPLVFIQNALMGFPCDPLTNTAAAKKTAQDWIATHNPELKDVIDNHCK